LFNLACVCFFLFFRNRKRNRPLLLEA